MGAMTWYNYLRRSYSRCSCDTTTTTNEPWSFTDTTDGYHNCPYCTSTTDGDTKQEEQDRWEKEQRREYSEIEELGRLARRIKVKVNIPVLPVKVINKTMQRRMMNGRR